jgi:hypothetical protein
MFNSFYAETLIAYQDWVTESFWVPAVSDRFATIFGDRDT